MIPLICDVVGKREMVLVDVQGDIMVDGVTHKNDVAQLHMSLGENQKGEQEVTIKIGNLVLKGRLVLLKRPLAMMKAHPDGKPRLSLQYVFTKKFIMEKQRLDI